MNATAFAPLQNDTFLRACLRQATEHTPLWLMRQAGRYLPEYCATRAQAGSFMGLATNVDYATEVTLQPLERYPLDAAILWGCPSRRARARVSPPRCATRLRWRSWPCPTWPGCAT